MSHDVRRNLANSFFLCVILFLVLNGVWTYSLFQDTFKYNSDMVTSYQAIRAANQSLISINEAAVEVSAYLLSNDHADISDLPETIVAAKVNIDTLRQLTADNPTAVKIFEKLIPLVDQKIMFLNGVVALYKSGDKNGAIHAASDKGRYMLTRQITQLIIDIKKLEMGTLDEAQPTYYLFKIEANKYFICSGLISIFLLLVSYVLMRRAQVKSL